LKIYFTDIHFPQLSLKHSAITLGK
jgi:hypothetical protein